MSGRCNRPVRESSDRSFQELTSNIGPHGGHSSFVCDHLQVHKNFKGIDGWFGAGFREIWENVNLTRYSSKQSEEWSMKNFLLSILRWHSSPIKNQISVLTEKRKRQDEKLIEIWQATMDGEDGWFRKLMEKNPECIIKVAQDCTKEVK